jgi:3-deoxy-manno-octulosonate cytidylyltransferase (CMP-KDO synthetase)
MDSVASTSYIVIPARLDSTRLPRKLLLRDTGKTVLQHTYEAALQARKPAAVWIAADHLAIVDEVKRFGGQVQMTDPAAASGTDRVAELARRLPAADIIVNVQGDEPFVTDEQVAAAVAEVRSGSDIGTVATPVRTPEAWRDASVVKVARRPDGAALYFSRSPIPWKREGEPDATELASHRYLRHVGIYALTRAALIRWTALPEGELERIERLEQLRALAAGMRIGVGVVADADGGIDTLDDARRAESRLRERSSRTFQGGAGE